MKFSPILLFFSFVLASTVGPPLRGIECANDGYFSGNGTYQCADVIWEDWQIVWKSLWFNMHHYSLPVHGQPPIPPYLDFDLAAEQALEIFGHYKTSDLPDHGGPAEMCTEPAVVEERTWYNEPGDVGCENENTCQRAWQKVEGDILDADGDCSLTTGSTIAYTRRKGFYCPSGYKYSGENPDGSPGFCYLKEGDSCPELGNPVTLSNAFKVASETDYTSAASDGIRFTRSYNLNGHFAYAGLYSGPPTVWFHNYGMAVYHKVNAQGNETAYVLRPNGARAYFWDNGNGFEGPPGSKLKLTAVKDGTGSITGWLFRGADDHEERFDSQGRLEEIVFVSGVRHQMVYGDGRLNQVIDSYGRMIEFDYGLEGRLAAMTAAGTTYHYEFNDRGLLLGVTYPDLTPTDPKDNPVKQYHYEDPAHPLALTGITDELGNRYASYEYRSNGRVQREVHYASPGEEINEYLFGYQNGPGSLTVTDPYGTSRSYYFGQNGSGSLKLTRVTQPCAACGLDKTLAYDGAGNLRYTLDFNNNRTNYSFNTRSLQVERTEAVGKSEARTTQTDWHPDFRRPTEIRVLDSAGSLVKKTLFDYDERGRTLRETERDPESHAERSQTFTYCTSQGVQSGGCPVEGLLLSVDGPRSDILDVTTYTYYSETTAEFSKGDLHRVTDALNHPTEFLSYDASGRPLVIRDPNGILTEMTYHPRGWLVSKAIAGLVTTYTYDDHGQLTRITEPDGSHTEYHYDMAHRLISLVDNLGNRVDYDLNSAGDIVEERILDGSGQLSKKQNYVYDDYGRLQRLIDGVGQSTELVYDLNGNPTSIIDANQESTDRTYDALNRLETTTNPMNGVTSTGFNALDQLTYVVDPRGNRTEYDYDSLGYLQELRSPDTGTSTFTYDASGNLVSSRDARGIVSSRTYDAMDRLTTVTFPNSGLNTSYVYDAGQFGRGRLTRIVNSTESIQYGYNEMGKVAWEQHDFGGGLIYRLSFYYDEWGRLQNLVYPSGNKANYHRDMAGRVSAIVLGLGRGITDIQRLPFGPVKSLTYGNGIERTSDFDLAYRQTSLRHGDFLSRDYSFDPSGKINAIDDLIDPKLSQSFGYDALDRITEAVGSYGHQIFTYDPVGNRTAFDNVSSGQSETLLYQEQSNRLVDWDGQPVSYTETGNISGIGSAWQRRFLQYDDANRLTAVTGYFERTYPTSHYNGRGEKAKISVLGDPSEFYLYDSSGRWVAEVAKNAQGEFDVIRENIYLDDRIVATFGEELFYTHTDHLGTPLAMTDESAAVAWKGDYEPFGGLASEGGRVANPHRFPGQFDDLATGFYYNVFRHYEPKLGRYLESDPIGLAGGLNTYSYVYGNPISWVDPLGLRACITLWSFSNDQESLVGRKDLGAEWELRVARPRRAMSKNPWLAILGCAASGCAFADCSANFVRTYREEYQTTQTTQILEMCFLEGSCGDEYSCTHWRKEEKIIGRRSKIDKDIERSATAHVKIPAPTYSFARSGCQKWVTTLK